MKYANDLILTDLARRITNEVADLNACLRDGYLDSAFLRARTMEKDLVGLMEVLNDIKYRKPCESR
jgi:hypothetical protein